MRFRSAVLTGLLAGATGFALVSAPTAAVAQTRYYGVADSRYDEAAVVRAFRSVLGRNPSSVELRRYAAMMDRYNWTEADVRRDLSERTDYRRYSQTRFDTDAVIRRAYLDILGREPDASGLSSYRQHIVQQGWSEWDLRQALRQSPEYSGGGSVYFRQASADRIIVRAYRDILHRNPDAAGLNQYRRAVIQEGWDEQDVRRALQSSPENRINRVSNTQYRYGTSYANEIVRRAYRNVFGREADATGLHDYGLRVMRDGWSQYDVERALRQSPEYRYMRR